MNPFRRDGLGWLSLVFIVLGAMVVGVHLLDVDAWLLGIFHAIPLIFGAIVLLTGIALGLAGLFDAKSSEE